VYPDDLILIRGRDFTIGSTVTEPAPGISLPILSLSEIRASDVRQHGGKAANLGELLGMGMNVPFGVSLGRDVFAYFLRENGIDLRALDRIHNLGMTFLESALSEAKDWQVRIVDTIASAPFPTAIEDRLLSSLGPIIDKSVAVRSSCVVEDSALASFAGQYSTILGITGVPDIIQAIRDCWSSQYSGRVLAYAIAHRGVPVLTPSMAVVIQKMLSPDFAGVCFTEGPTPKTKAFTIVESVPGVGESLVSGSTTPSHFEVNADTTIHRRVLAKSETASYPSDDVISCVVARSLTIAKHFGCPQDVEWATLSGSVYILQARPITVVGGKRGSLPAGLVTRPSKEGTQQPSDAASASILLRDDLHDWIISQADPAMVRGVCFLLSSQSAEGCWKIEGHPEWDAVSTALMLRIVIDGGVPPTLSWSLPDNTAHAVVGGVPLGITWLALQAKDDGTWGSDLWDTCQVIRALLKCGVKADEPAISKALEYLVTEISGGLDVSRRQEWFGAGFLAAALTVFEELRLDSYADRCVQTLIDSQSADGDFQGPNARLKGSQIPSEWHTSQAISALTRHGRHTDRTSESVMRACEWLLKRQNLNGSWGPSDEPYSAYNSFFTAYAVMAIADGGRREHEALVRAKRWLRGRQFASGAFGDIGSSLMSIAAFQTLDGPLFALSIPIPLFLRIQAILAAQ